MQPALSAVRLPKRNAFAKLEERKVLMGENELIASKHSDSRGGDCYVPRRNAFAKLEERKVLMGENELIASKHSDSRGGDCYVPRRNAFVKLEERKVLMGENELIASKHSDSRGGDCYVPRRNSFAKLEERKVLMGENEFIASKHSDSRGKDGRKTFKKRFFEHPGNKPQSDLDSERPSSTLPRGKAPSGRPNAKGGFQNQKWNRGGTDKDVSGTVLTQKGTMKNPNSVTYTPTVPSAAANNAVSRTAANVTKNKSTDHPSATTMNVDSAMKQPCKRVRKKQWNYEEPKPSPCPPTEKGTLQTDLRNCYKYKTVAHNFTLFNCSSMLHLHMGTSAVEVVSST
ncbi:hypothetical protein NDU88_002441 [Pleurodeles waltl]|uniref:Uncharacterized protein n=1 Tax=Pleurodeles waltl TaxID=8319 RepID=A0AAV7SAH1_PLEWA|nr:hypothetical protein NDU88_002441 [Pleurodeles waltl]